MAFKQEINVPLIVTVGIISAILLMVMITGTEAWYKSEEDNEVAVKAENFPDLMKVQLHDEQKGNLAKYAWVDRNNNVIQIPIEDAMKVMVETHGNLPASRP